MKVGKASHQAHVQHSVHKGALPGAVAMGRCYSNQTNSRFYLQRVRDDTKRALTRLLLLPLVKQTPLLFCKQNIPLTASAFFSLRVKIHSNNICS